MPCDTRCLTVNNEYSNCINFIEQLLNGPNCNCFIGAGDYNTSFSRHTGQTYCLNDFMSRNELSVSWDHPSAIKGDTYCNLALNHFSCIDHFIVSQNVFDCILSHHVICQVENPSTHNIVSLSLDICIHHSTLLPKPKMLHNIPCNWSKASPEDINRYTQILNNKLNVIAVPDCMYCTNCHCRNVEHRRSIDLFCQSVIECCISASKQSIPTAGPNVRKTVPGWTEQVAPEKETSLFWHWLWLEAGKPNTGYVYNIMKRTRHKYHYAVRCCKKKKLNNQKIKLAENISDPKEFWKELKKLNPANKITTETMDNVNGNENITNILYDKYKTLYNSVPTSDHELSDIRSIVDSGMNSEEVNRYQVTPVIIEQCIKQLKSGKNDGNCGFNSNHLINGGIRLHTILSLLFNVMLMHGYNAKELIVSSIISIPKDLKSSLCKSDNYRGISLFNSICKVFDYVIMYICGDILQSSDMQFGFKQNHSTVLCSLVYKEVISHYLHSGSNVYSCLLDASKAFDRIHFGKLFRLLLERQVPFCVTRLVLDAYTRQMSRVFWNNLYSAYFSVSNGVKQGGVLSPTLFNIYIDRLLLLLEKSGYGCHLNNTYIGAVAYADDVTLSCPSRRGLNRMLELCCSYAMSNDIMFNTKKTVCIKYGEPVTENEHVYFSDVSLAWHDNVRHLGNYFDTNISDLTDSRFKCSAFIGYVNKLMSNFGYLQPDILGNLFKTYCCSYYGSFLWQYNSAGFTKYCTEWNKAVRQIYSLPYNSHRWLLGPLLDQSHIKFQLYVRDIKLLYKMYYCVNNKIVKQCLNNAIHNSNTVIGYKLAYFREEFDVELFICDINTCLKYVRPASLSVEQQALVDCLHVLTLTKSNELTVPGFQMDELNDIIDFISTS